MSAIPLFPAKIELAVVVVESLKLFSAAPDDPALLLVNVELTIRNVLPSLSIPPPSVLASLPLKVTLVSTPSRRIAAKYLRRKRIRCSPRRRLSVLAYRQKETNPTANEVNAVLSRMVLSLMTSVSSLPSPARESHRPSRSPLLPSAIPGLNDVRIHSHVRRQSVKLNTRDFIAPETVTPFPLIVSDSVTVNSLPPRVMMFSPAGRWILISSGSAVVLAALIAWRRDASVATLTVNTASIRRSSSDSIASCFLWTPWCGCCFRLCRAGTSSGRRGSGTDSTKAADIMFFRGNPIALPWSQSHFHGSFSV